MKIKSLIFLLLFISSPLKIHAQLIETSDITRILDFVLPEAVVVLDLDNTVIKPKQLIGSDQWFRHHIDHLCQHGHSVQQALSLTLPLYHEVMKRSAVGVVDPRTPKIIQDLQLANIPVMALTSRGAALKDATSKQLQSVSVDLNHGRFKNQQFSFDPQNQSIMHHGIIFADGKNKGEKLLDYFDKAVWQPKRIIFVDDQLKNVNQVREHLIPNAYDVIGIRYGFLDNETEVNLSIAAIQKEFVHQLLSNEEAKVLLEYREKNISSKG